MPTPPEGHDGGSTKNAQMSAARVAGVFAVVAAIVGAVVTGGFGLIAGDRTTSTTARHISVSGGSSSNTGVCVSGGVYVGGTINCAPSTKPATPSQLVHFTTYTNHETGSPWVVPHGVPPPPGNCAETEVDNRIAWLERHGTSLGELQVSVQVVDDSQDTLVFQHIGLRSYEQRPRITGRTYFTCEPGSGPVGGQFIELNLDKRPPTFEFFNNRFQPTTPFAFSPSHGEPAVFFIKASAAQEGHQNDSSYRWTLTLSYTLGAKKGVYVIANHGKQFEMTDGP
jgi:hypothetical protein